MGLKIASSNVHMTSQVNRSTRMKFVREEGMMITSRSALAQSGLSVGQRVRIDGEDFEVLAHDLENAEQNPQQGQNNQNNNRTGQVGGANPVRPVNPFARFASSFGDARVTLLVRLLEAMTGRRIDAGERLREMFGANVPQGTINGNQQPPQNPQGDNIITVLQFSRITKMIHEKESVSFTTTANITTECGKEINIEMALKMTRELYARFDSVNLSILEFVDPLVINFDAAYARLSDTKIEFDLTADGTPNQISKLLQGSAFLARDNGSGTVEDGRQLFGALCGNGFAHLAQYDTDGNGWIDANDDIWDCLRLWIIEPDGTYRLVGLAEKGIGAIFLGNVNTNMSMEGESGEIQGMLRRTGFFLFTDGSAGTVQHVDLRV